MSKHSITLKREGMRGFLSDQSVGTDALNALSSIPGIDDLEIVDETDERVILTYTWVGTSKFWKTDERLLQFGLSCVDD